MLQKYLRRRVLVVAALLLAGLWLAPAIRANTIGQSPGAAGVVRSGRLTSTGSTPLVLFPAVTGKVNYVSGATIYSIGTATHTCTVTSQPSGELIDEFPVAPAVNWGCVFIDEVKGWQSNVGERIELTCDVTGSGADLKFIGQSVPK